MAYVDLGNCVEASIENSVTKKEHKKSSGGKRTKDRTDITEVGAKLNIKLDEINGLNCSILGLATPITLTDGSIKLIGLSKTVFTGKIKIEGDNDRGPTITYIANVSFTPAGTFKFIQDGDDYNVIELECDVEQNDDDEGFGTWTIVGSANAPNIENYQIPTGKVYFEADA